MLRQAVIFGVSFALLRDPSCGGGAPPTSSGVNAPCTRTKDCHSGLVCEKGVCTEPDGEEHAQDAGPVDAGDGG